MYKLVIFFTFVFIKNIMDSTIEPLLGCIQQLVQTPTYAYFAQPRHIIHVSSRSQISSSKMCDRSRSRVFPWILSPLRKTLGMHMREPWDEITFYIMHLTRILHVHMSVPPDTTLVVLGSAHLVSSEKIILLSFVSLFWLGMIRARNIPRVWLHVCMEKLHPLVPKAVFIWLTSLHMQRSHQS